MGSRKRHQERLPQAAETAATLVPDHVGPVIQGDADDGIDYVCGNCGAVIAECVVADQFFEFGVVCARCKVLIAFGSLPPGRPLPSGKTVVLNDGSYRLGSTVESRSDVVMAGEEAVRQREREIGRASSARSGTTSLDEGLLRAMVSEAQQLLGARYKQLAASHARGKQSPTAPKDPHRLMELIDAANDAAASFAAGEPEIDAVATAELHTALASFTRWKNDPCWPSIVGSLGNPSDYLHAVVLLVTASYLTDAGNGVELVDAPGDKRTADMRIHVTAETSVNTEVKTPRALNHRDVPLTVDDARKIVRDQMSSARTAVGGQLDPSRPGILIIGGFGLHSGDQTALRIAARQELQRRGASTSHVLGIALVSLAAVLDASPEMGAGASLTGAAQTEIVLNPQYEGTVAVQTGRLPGQEAMSDAVPLRYGQEKPVGRNDPCWCGSGKKFKRCHGA
jgi:hypothetical protein